MGLSKTEIERKLKQMIGNPLFDAARLDDVGLMQGALDRGRSLNEQGPGSGFTPLHTAALNGSLRFLEEALKIKHVDPWIRDSKGMLAIDHAEVRRDRAAMNLLFEAMYPNGRVRFTE